MKVSELIDLLHKQDQDANVVVFDHHNRDHGISKTITANCLLSVQGVVIVCAQDED